MGFLTSILGQSTVQAVGAGVLTGALGGAALIGTGVIPIAPETVTPPTIELRACPGEGPVLGQVADGERLLVTAKSADGQWLEVYVGQPGIDRAWAEAAALSLEAPGDALPVGDCAAPTPAPLPSPAPTGASATEAPTAAPTLGPSPSLATTETPGVTATATATASPTATPKPTKTPSPTPKPTKTPTPPPPTPTPTPMPPPDNTKPQLSGLGASPTCVDPGHIQARISVTATDNVAVTGVQISFTPPGQGAFVRNMNHGSGNTWIYDVFQGESGAWGEGHVSYTVIAVDFAGNTSNPASNNVFSSDNYLYSSTSSCFIG